MTVPSGVVCVCPARVALRRLQASPDAHTHTLAPPGGTSALLAQQGPEPGLWWRALTRPLPVQVGCKLSLVFFQYCIMANFYWLLVEGLYLHTLLAVIFAPGRRFRAYLLIGWGEDSPCLPGAPGSDLPTETLSAQKNLGLPRRKGVNTLMFGEPGNESESCSVVSDSLQPHGLHSPWNSPEYWSG